MSPPAKSSAALDPEQLHRGLQRVGGLGATLLNLAVLVWHWGDWVTWGVTLAVAAVLPVFNMWLTERLARRVKRSVVEALRMLGNVVGISLGGHFASWSPVMWAWVPFNMLWFYGLDDQVRPRTAVYLLLMNAIALADGSNPSLALAFSALGVVGYLLLERRAELFQHALAEVVSQREQLRRAHQELEQMHERALAQEKLSSLGVMAAGVAHEINNPMAYVTSNVNGLLKDLKRQPSLPEELREYVTDVLPATLDGIKRVNAIVGDLRRFARGEPEVDVEYDFNAEVQAALRIASGQLRHCTVELALGEVGTVVGRPRQVVQALVNLLVNAGQATPPGGQVRLSTALEEDQVRVEVEDTGTGMSEEVQRQLFQPFFTTKPVGTGTGLGLAVVHGIIHSHGGRIHVRSRLGEGSCFILHFPRRCAWLEPPRPRQAASAQAQAHAP